MDAEEVTWSLNYHNSFINSLDQDELAILDADVRDAIDGVIEDWKGR